MRPLLAALLASEAFWAPENRGRLVKSPVDLIVGTLRLFALPVENARDLAWLSRRLGQDLFDPPDVSGWPGGTRSEEHTSELQSLMRISYAVFCLKKKKKE